MANDKIVDFILTDQNLLPIITKDSTAEDVTNFQTLVKIWSKYEFEPTMIFDDRNYNAFEIINIVEALGKINKHVPSFVIKKGNSSQEGVREYQAAVKQIIDTHAVENYDISFSSIQSFITNNLVNHIDSCEPETVFKLTARYFKLVAKLVTSLNVSPTEFKTAITMLNFDRDLGLAILLSHRTNKNIETLISYLS